MRARGLLLWPGSGGDPDHRHFMALEDALDIPVRRLRFEYSLNGSRRPPPRADKLIPELNAAVEEAAAELGIDSANLLLGGRSMGGRVCSMAVAGGLPAAGLVLLSYPLHPPGKPEKLRVEHFGRLEVPVLFVSGDRDPFGRPHEWTEHLETIAGDVSFTWLRGDGHDPRKNDELLVDSVARWVTRVG